MFQHCLRVILLLNRMYHDAAPADLLAEAVVVDVVLHIIATTHQMRMRKVSRPYGSNTRVIVTLDRGLSRR